MVPLVQIFMTQTDYTYRKKGNLKLAESIFNSIEVSNDSNHNKFSKSYKMAVSFKLNNAEFPPLPFRSTSKPNVYNVAKYVTSTYVCEVFPSTHNSISIPTKVYCPKNNNIANSHLPLTNPLLHLKQNLLPYL